jgi:Rod binding domain-containing protein
MDVTAPGLGGNGPAARPAPGADDARLRRTADAFEAAFLAEMLKDAGLGKVPDAFGGGEGEDQFASFLRQEQAKAITAHGGIGLSQVIYEAMKENYNG